MNEDEMQRLRDRITHDQTACRCGHLLAACADCRDWLLEHSPRIAAGWRWYLMRVVPGFAVPAGLPYADAAEAYDRARYGL